MSLVSTGISTLDNQMIMVPNNKIWGDVIKNVTAQDNHFQYNSMGNNYYHLPSDG